MMRFAYLANFLALALVSVKALTLDRPDIQKDLGYAIVEGQGGGIAYNSWLGVRYGTAKRFQRATIPATNRSSIQPVKVVGPACYQTGSGFDALPQSEDCLLLNVYAPWNAKNLPVVVYIYGGGFQTGSINSNPWINVFQKKQDYIYVAIQYRIGAFGFLSSSTLRQHGDVNLGLYDQQLGLEWVQDHISKFGGDPSRVTIWGESAGGGSVMLQNMAYGGNIQQTLNRTKPLFTATMPQSPYLGPMYPFDGSVPTKFYDDLRAVANCNQSAPQDQFNCLSSIDGKLLANLSSTLYTTKYPTNLPYLPVVDKKFLTKSPIELLRQGAVHTKNVFVVDDLYEGLIYVDPKLFLSPGPDAAQDLTGFLKNLLPLIPSEDINKVLSAYPAGAFPSNNNTWFRAVAIQSDLWISCGAYQASKSFPSTTYSGRFTVWPAVHVYHQQLLNDPLALLPADMMREISEAFHNYFIRRNPADGATSQALSKWPVWGDGKQQYKFAVAKEPTQAELAPLWAKALQKAASGGAITDILPDVVPVLLVPSASNVSAVQDVFAQRCELWAKLYPTFSGYNN